MQDIGLRLGNFGGSELHLFPSCTIQIRALLSKRLRHHLKHKGSRRTANPTPEAIMAIAEEVLVVTLMAIVTDSGDNCDRDVLCLQ